MIFLKRGEIMDSMTMTNEEWEYFESLKCEDFSPCPFCGKQQAFLMLDNTFISHIKEPRPHLFNVACGYCCAETAGRFDPYQAISCWELRASVKEERKGNL